jgi:hypothetical protein
VIDAHSTVGVDIIQRPDRLQAEAFSAYYEHLISTWWYWLQAVEAFFGILLKSILPLAGVPTQHAGVRAPQWIQQLVDYSKTKWRCTTSACATLI